jgi:nitrous oxidase accessory protein NosD
VAGVLPTLFKLNDADRMVISGLEFRDAAPEGSGKYGTDTRGFGAVRLEHSDQVKLEGNVFTNIGVAIHISESNDVVVENNEIGHAAGNGIYLGTNFGTFQKSNRAAIVRNHIHDVGEVYFESAGVWFQAADDARVAFNFIENTAQFGIAGGSIWGPQDASYGNIIEYNLVRNANQQTSDGGAIKMMGEQADRQNSVVRYNLVMGTDQLMNRADGSFWPSGYEDTKEWPSPISWAIYTDGKASGIRIEGNVLLGNVSGIGINGGWSNVVTGNVIAYGSGMAFRVDDATGRSWRPVWAEPNRIEGNVVSANKANGGIAHVYAPDHSAGYVSFRRNMYFGKAGFESFYTWPPVMSSNGFGSLVDFQQVGQDVGSVMVGQR